MTGIFPGNCKTDACCRWGKKASIESYWLNFTGVLGVDSEEFNLEYARLAAEALQEVLAARTHRKKYLGKIYTVPGRLGEALKLPAIIGKLNSRVSSRQETGLEEFQFLWDTLSEPTRESVLDLIGWYEPKELDWEDKRSNRRPKLTE